jgi:hypothetical protein
VINSVRWHTLPGQDYRRCQGEYPCRRIKNQSNGGSEPSARTLNNWNKRLLQGLLDRLGFLE